MEKIFLELTIIIGLAAVLSIIFKFLKQPAILAYILAGILLGPLQLYHIEGVEVVESLSQVGITLLLFMLGLEMKLKDLRSVGKTALLSGIGQIVFTSIIGFLLALAFGFTVIASIYISVALTFSSTIIVIKLLSDKKDLKSLYGKISVGFLLVQDFVAIIALIILSGFNTSGGGEISLMTFLILMIKAAVLIGWITLLSKTLLPKIMLKIAKSPEVLFLFSLAWAFIMAAIISSPFVGFSIEIGGFLAGLSLANSSQNFHIVSRIRSLRDFFITIFFVMLGMKLIFSDMSSIALPAIVLSLFVLIGNPLIVMIILGLLGFKKRTSFLAGLTVAQISEFSLIVIFMGNTIGHVPDQVISLITTVGIITFVGSTYMILNGNKLFSLLSPLLSVFEKKSTHETKLSGGELGGHVVLVGSNKMGESILEALLHSKENVLVVDFDPEVIERLSKRGITCIYGDIADKELQEVVSITTARAVISTVPDVDDNLSMLDSLHQMRKPPLTVVYAPEVDDAKALYAAGATYVVLPHLVGGRHLAKMLLDKNHLQLIEDYKAKDLSDL